MLTDDEIIRHMIESHGWSIELCEMCLGHRGNDRCKICRGDGIYIIARDKHTCGDDCPIVRGALKAKVIV